MPFEIRLYSPTDFETLYAIDTACYPRGIAYSRRTLKWFLLQPGAECLVAVEADAPGPFPEQSVRSAGKKVQADAPGRSAEHALTKQTARAPGTTPDATVSLNPNIIGFIIGQADPPEAHIITLDVSESHRRSGTGTALLAQMERRLANRGVQFAVLETATTNEGAVAFWTRHGYRSVGVLRRYYLNRIDAYVMQKILAAEQFTDEDLA